jgi:hypothetical protein
MCDWGKAEQTERVILLRVRGLDDDCQKLKYSKYEKKCPLCVNEPNVTFRRNKHLAPRRIHIIYTRLTFRLLHVPQRFILHIICIYHCCHQVTGMVRHRESVYYSS